MARTRVGRDEFERFVEPHLHVLSAVGRRLVARDDVDDLVQETLLRAWRRRVTYRPELGTARGWLVAILVDRAAKSRSRSRPFDRTLTDEPGADPHLLTADLLDLDRAIAALPVRQHQVVTLYYIADLPVKEIARSLRVSEGTVKSQLHDARSRLRTALTRPSEAHP